MLKYRSLFKMKFIASLQYRAAAWAGIVTQFVWGLLEILLFKTFYLSNPSAFPMEFTAVVAYIWLQQAFLALYMLWFWENDIFESIESGNIAYELVRPVSIYNMWFVRSSATRLAKTVLRSLPILLIALCLPQPYNLILPSSLLTFSWFILTMFLALMIVISLNMLIYFWSFYTINSLGIRMVFQSLGDILMGAIIPLPFFPAKIQHVLELLPFGATQNIPLRIYSGDISGSGIFSSIGLQLFWLVSLVLVGKFLEMRVVKDVVVQGG